MARFNPFHKHDWKHAADKAKHAAEDAAKKARDAEEKARREAEAKAEALAKQLEHEFMTSITDIKHLSETVQHDIQGVETKAIHDIQGEALTAKHDIESAGNAVKKTLDESGDGWKKIIDQTVSDAKADIEKIAKSETAELTEEAVHKGLKKADALIKKIDGMLDKFADSHPALVAHLNQIGDDINLGPLKLSYANFYSRAQEIGDALDKTMGGDFHLTQTFLDDLIRGLGPDSVTIDADVEFISTFGDDLKTIPLDVFIEIADIVFDAVGVPKE